MHCLPPELRPRLIWIGRRLEYPQHDRAETLLPSRWSQDYPFVFVSSHESTAVLKQYYVDDQHAKLRGELYAKLEPRLGRWLRDLGLLPAEPEHDTGSEMVAQGLSREKKRVVFDAVEAIASQFIKRLDYAGGRLSPAQASSAASFGTIPSGGQQGTQTLPPLTVLLSSSWGPSEHRTTAKPQEDIAQVIETEVQKLSHSVKLCKREGDYAILDTVDCLLLWASADTMADLEVVEELTRAQERGVRIIPILDPENKPSDTAFLHDIVFIPYKSGEGLGTFLNDVTTLLQKLCEEEDGQLLRVIQRNRQLVKLARDVTSQGAQQPFRAGIIKDLLEEVEHEIEGIAKGYYGTDIGIERSFLRRASTLFSSAQQIYAVSYDEISGFWTAPHLSADADEYRKKQPTNTVRLFVFGSAASADRHRRVLQEHHSQYGKDGAVLICSTATYSELVVPNVSTEGGLTNRWRDVDFGVLQWWQSQGTALTETVLAILESSRLVFKNVSLSSTLSNVDGSSPVDPQKVIEGMEEARKCGRGA
jgi:hypothetical protein